MKRWHGHIASARQRLAPNTRAVGHPFVRHVRNDKDEQALKKLDSVSHACIAVGLALLMAGIIMGALWAKDAWGSYWSWDPKETWSLITAAIYAAYLIVRKTGISAEDAALLSLLGFMAVLLTYLGVSYIIPGLHSYA